MIDAMNVIGSRPDGWWRDRQGAIRRFADRVEAWSERRGIGAESTAAPEWDGVTVVIDGRPISGVAEGDGEWLEVVYAPGRRNAADDRIVALVERDPAAGELVVITSDRELRERVERLGASVRGAGWLLDELER